MDTLAKKLMTLQGNNSLNLSSDSLTLDLRPRYRMGIWPCVSESDPELAMGLFTVLSYLLEQWQGIRVYSIFASVEDAPESYVWSVDDSQFSVDDWQIDDLDENIALWGTLHHAESEWVLKIEVENDFAADDEENKVLSYKASDIVGLVEALPKAAWEIAEYLDLAAPTAGHIVYTSAAGDEKALQEFLKNLFHWELNLYLSLWGKTWSEADVRKAQSELLAAGQPLGNDFAAWSVASAISRALQPGFDMEGLVSTVPAIIEQYSDFVIPSVLISKALNRIEYVEEAVDLLEVNVEKHPDNHTAWQALADLYIENGQPPRAVDAYQRAIEADVADTDMYMNYATQLEVLDYEGWSVRQFIFIDPEEKSRDHLVWEAVEAYQAVLDKNPKHIDALYGQLLLFVDNALEDERLWKAFGLLVELDDTGDKVRAFVSSLYSLGEASDAIRLLREAARQKPTRPDLRVNLAAALLIDEESDLAQDELDKARGLTTDPVMLAEIDRLTMIADDPDFEAQLGDITDILNAGNVVDTESVEFLEDAVERVPTFSEGYVLLARAYQGWDEPATALETLLDGYKHLPDDPEIITMLGKALWESGQQKLAFEYLNKGLAQNPEHVPLLVQSAGYLFENEQEDEAKLFIARAEQIAPRHPALVKVRRQIGRVWRDELEDE